MERRLWVTAKAGGGLTPAVGKLLAVNSRHICKVHRQALLLAHLC